MNNAYIFTLFIFIILAVTVIFVLKANLNHRQRIDQIKSYELRSENETQRLKLIIQALSRDDKS